MKFENLCIDLCLTSRTLITLLDHTSGSEDPLNPDKINPWAERSGLPREVCRNLVNPGFEDPFDVRKVWGGSFKG